MTQETWAARTTWAVVDEVKRQRELRKWSAQRLSEECGKLGFSISRNTISDLENHRRSHFGIPELLVFARALGIPPLLLLFRVGAEEETEVVPGEFRPPFRAALWFSGESASASPAQADGEVIVGPAYHGPGRPLALYRLHDEQFRREMGTLAGVQSVAEQAKALPEDRRENVALAITAFQDAAEEFSKNAERIRQEAAAEGMIPPARIMGLITDDTKETEAER